MKPVWAVQAGDCTIFIVGPKTAEEVQQKFEAKLTEAGRRELSNCNVIRVLDLDDLLRYTELTDFALVPGEL